MMQGVWLTTYLQSCVKYVTKRNSDKSLWVWIYVNINVIAIYSFANDSLETVLWCLQSLVVPSMECTLIKNSRLSEISQIVKSPQRNLQNLSFKNWVGNF